MLVEFNSYSINDKVITLYCTNVENTFDRNRHYPQEVMYSFDTSKKCQTRTLMNWLLKQKAVKELKGTNPTWGDVLTSILGTVVNVSWSKYRVYA